MTTNNNYIIPSNHKPIITCEQLFLIISHCNKETKINNQCIELIKIFNKACSGKYKTISIPGK
jgi:hypothetical protein